jgi:hypothetical protein
VSVAERYTNFNSGKSYNPKHQHVFPQHQQEMMLPSRIQQEILLSCIPTSSAGNIAFMNSVSISRKCCFHVIPPHQHEFRQHQQEMLLSCNPTASAGNIAFMY